VLQVQGASVLVIELPGAVFGSASDWRRSSTATPLRQQQPYCLAHYRESIRGRPHPYCGALVQILLNKLGLAIRHAEVPAAKNYDRAARAEFDR